jgi:UDP-N-acetylmuramoyl-L-alanyl-D-glutamate--2,6-diaminopimelate ligase
LVGHVTPAITYSARGAADATLRAIESSFDAAGIRARIATPEGEIALRSPLVGAHNLENLLAALGSLVALDIPARDAASALADAAGAPGRLERVAVESGAIDRPAVFVDYAHTPDALARVLAALRATKPTRSICVFGCGGDRDPTKRAPMGAAVAAGADVAILTTDNPRTEDPATIAAMAEKGLVAAGVPRIDRDALRTSSRGYLVELDRRTAIALAISHARSGDVILVAGKGHEPYQEVHGVRTPFDDRIEARKALQGGS